jgi:ribosomal protein S18 acetylase RimI-like enzyme
VDTVEERAHRNLCDFTRFTARLDRGGRVFDQRGVVALIGSADWPSSRTAVRSDHAVAPSEWVSTVQALFDAHGKTGCVFARVGADDDLHGELVARGFTEWAQTPEMVCDRELPRREPPPGVTVRLAASAPDVATYAEIAGRAFAHLSIPEHMTREAVDNPDVLLRPDCAIALAELDGLPVAGALVVLLGDDPAGYVGWVACADEARGRGLGDVVTRAVTNEAFARGAPIVTLEASEFGEHTYARMGYREVYRYRVLIRV